MEDECRQLRDRNEQARLNWLTEHEERVNEIQNLYERRQQMLQDENDRLRTEKDQLETEVTQLQSGSLYRDWISGPTGDSSSENWEAKLGEILQWVNDEKEAR